MRFEAIGNDNGSKIDTSHDGLCVADPVFVFQCECKYECELELECKLLLKFEFILDAPGFMVLIPLQMLDFQLMHQQTFYL